MEILQEHTRCELSCVTRFQNAAEGRFHWHENYEICQVLSNHCRFRIDGVIYYANAGDIVTINQHTVHQFLIDNDNTHLRIIQFHPKILMNITYCSGNLKPHITREEIESIPDLAISINSISSLMDTQQQCVMSHDNLYFQCLCTSLFFLLQKHFGQENESSVTSGQRNDFYRIVDYINNHFEEDISVNSIATHFYFSRGKLSSVFKKYSGISITDYIQTLRIKKANILLSQGASVTVAALSSGFESIRTFNNTYRKIMGITPSEYTKNK